MRYTRQPLQLHQPPQWLSGFDVGCWQVAAGRLVSADFWLMTDGYRRITDPQYSHVISRMPRVISTESVAPQVGHLVGASRTA